MKKECAWCKKELETDALTEKHLISHGICNHCMNNILTMMGKNTLVEFLDKLSYKVMLVSKEGRVLGANQEMQDTLGKDYKSLVDQLGGDVMGCRYAGLPGGCGNTIHCKSCAIRKSIQHTYETGESLDHIPAHINQATPDGDFEINFLISTEKADDMVLLRVDEMKEPIPIYF